MADPTVHSIFAPSSVGPAVPSLAVPGVVVHDDWAASWRGGMALNVTCLHGVVSMGGTWANAFHLGPLTLVQVNAMLALLRYVPALSGVVPDTIRIDVWNQAGKNYGVTVPVTSPTPAPVPPLTITPGSGLFEDGAGNVYAIDPAGNAMKNGARIPGGGGTSAMALIQSTIYGQDAATKNWYIWDQKTWTGPVRLPTP